jgi:hypothetical protein
MALTQSQGQLQTLRISPQQIQYIKLLQLQGAEIQSRVDEELQTNPALDQAAEDSENPTEAAQTDDSEVFNEASKLSDAEGEYGDEPFSGVEANDLDYTDQIDDTREIREETGLRVPLSRIIQLELIPFAHYRVSYFGIPLTSEEIQSILHYFEQRQRSHCGELFQLEFRHLPFVNEPMNHVTRLVSQWLQSHPPLPRIMDNTPIQFEPTPPAPPTVQYNTARIIEPVFRRGVQRHSLLPL